MKQSPYQLLGVSATATQDDIKNAYRNLAKKFHPDLNPGNSAAEAKFKAINTAYEQVGTEESRAQFERGEKEEALNQENHWQQRSSPGNENPGPTHRPTHRPTHDFFDRSGRMDTDPLRAFFEGRARRTANWVGEDVNYQMELAFRDAILGCEKEITLTHGRRLKVKIPPGVESGARLRFAGQGRPGVGTGKPGDAFVEIRVAASAIYKRNGMDLELKLPISLSEALLGADVRVPTLTADLTLKVPPGLAYGARLRVSGHGVKSADGSTQGDLFVLLRIVMPNAVDPEYLAATRSWSLRQPSDPRSEWVGYDRAK